MKLPNKRGLIHSVVYVVWFLVICSIFRGDNNLSYAYIAAWCSGLWISAIFKDKTDIHPTFFLATIEDLFN